MYLFQRPHTYFPPSQSIKIFLINYWNWIWAVCHDPKSAWNLDTHTHFDWDWCFHQQEERKKLPCNDFNCSFGTYQQTDCDSATLIWLLNRLQERKYSLPQKKRDDLINFKTAWKILHIAKMWMNEWWRVTISFPTG